MNDDSVRVTVPNEILLPQIRELILNGHTVTFPVRGNSMNPFIKDRRDKVIIAPLSGEPRIGDLLLAYEIAQKRYVLHRLIRVENESYLLMGDGNTHLTEAIQREEIIAIVTAIIRKNKTYSTHSKLWNTYSWIWMKLLPLRQWILAVWRRLQLN